MAVHEDILTERDSEGMSETWALTCLPLGTGPLVFLRASFRLAPTGRGLGQCRYHPLRTGGLSRKAMDFAQEERCLGRPLIDAKAETNSVLADD